jgi:hypothetical protein
MYLPIWGFLILLVVGCHLEQDSDVRAPADTLNRVGLYEATGRLFGGKRYYMSARITRTSPQFLYLHWAAADPQTNEITSRAPSDPCAVAVHLLQGNQIVWQSERAADGPCLFADYRLHENAFTAEYPVRRILGDSLPAGDYRLRMVLHIKSDTLLSEHGPLHLSRDSLPPLADPSQVQFDAVLTHFNANQLGVQLLYQSRSARTIQIDHGAPGCALRLQFVHVGEPQRKWVQPLGCPDYLVEMLVYPGQVRVWPEHPHTLELSQVLGDTLPTGLYSLSLRFIYDAGLKGGVLREDTAVIPITNLELSR